MTAGRRLGARRALALLIGVLSLVSVLIVLTPSSASAADTPRFSLSVTRVGSGVGSVSSTPAGIACGSTCTASFTSGTTVTLTAKPDAGSTFDGWDGTCTPTADPNACTVEMTSAQSVTARFGGPTHQLAVALAGMGRGAVTSTPAGIDCPAVACTAELAPQDVKLTVTPSDLSTFAGWSGDCTGTHVSCTVRTDRARWVTATFTANPRRLTTGVDVGRGHVDGGGTGASNPISCPATACSATFPYRASAWLRAVPDTGWHFTGWSATSGCPSSAFGQSPSCTLTMDWPRSAYASFAINRYKLEASITGNGGGSIGYTPPAGGYYCHPDRCSGEFDHGTQVTLTARPNTTSSFGSWGGACTAARSNPTCTVDMTAVTWVSASFNQLPRTITVTSTGDGRITSTPAGLVCEATTCTATFGYRTEVRLDAAAGDGSTFTGWSGACSGTGPCTVTADMDRSVTATFAASPRDLSVSRDGTGSGTITSAPTGISCGSTCSVPFAFGTTVTLTASIAPGSRFVGWTGDCSGTAKTCTVKMDRVRWVSAVFASRLNALSIYPSELGTVTSDVGGISCPSVCTAQLFETTTVTLTATPIANAHFMGWLGACSGSAPTCTVTMETARGVAAAFARSSAAFLVIDSVTGGAIWMGDFECTSWCTTPLVAPGTRTFTVQADPGWEFVGWTRECASVGATPICDVVLDADGAYVGAVFRPRSHTLVLRTEGTGSLTPYVNGADITSMTGDCTTSCSIDLREGSMIGFETKPGDRSVFDGWSGACIGTAPACIVTMTEDRTLTASFGRVYRAWVGVTGGGTITVGDEFSCRGTCASPPVRWMELLTFTAVPDPGWEFVGWSQHCESEGTKPDCTTYVFDETVVVAQFRQRLHTLAINVAGPLVGFYSFSSSAPIVSYPSSCAVQACPVVLPEGTRVTLTRTAMLDGGVFVGWSGACTGTAETCVIDIQADTSVTLTFNVYRSADVVVTNGVGGTISAGDLVCRTACRTRPVLDGTEVTFTATPDPYWTFAGWGGACAHANPRLTCTIPVSEAATVSVKFAIEDHELTINLAGDGTGMVDVVMQLPFHDTPPWSSSCGQPACSVRLPEGTALTLTGRGADVMSAFTGWTGSCSGTAPTCAFVLTADASATATVGAKTGAGIAVVGGGGGVSFAPGAVVCRETCTSPLVVRGTTVTFTAVPDEHFEFMGWKGACASEGTKPTCTMPLWGIVWVGATFAPDLATLTVGRSGGGRGTVGSAGWIDCGTLCSATSYDGYSFALHATPTAGSMFVGWSGACTGTSLVCDVTLDGDQSVTAIFEPARYRLDVSITGAGDGTVRGTKYGIDCPSDCDETLPLGTAVVIVATPDDDSRLVRWEGCSSINGRQCRVTMSRARSVRARFEPNPRNALVVTVAGEGSGTVTADSGGLLCPGLCSSYYDDDSEVVLTAAPSGSDVFTGWSGECSGTSTTCTITMSERRDVTATFANPPVTLTVIVDGLGTGTVRSDIGGLDCGAICEIDVAEGTELLLSADPDGGSEVLDWDGAGCDGSALTCSITLTDDTAMIVTFDPINPVLSVDHLGGTVESDVGGIDCPGTCAAAYTPGTTVTLTAVAPAGIATTTWDGCDSTPATDTCIVTVTTDTTIELRYSIPFTIIVGGAGAFGRVDTDIDSTPLCTSTCAPLVVYGSTVTVTAVPNGGRAVDDWDGCDATDGNTCTVVVNDFETVEVTFT